MSPSQRNEAQIEDRLRRHLAEAGEQVVDRPPPAVEQGGGLSGRVAMVAAALLVVAGGAYLMRPADQSTPTVADATAAEPTPTTRTTLVEEVEPIPEGDPGSKSNPIPLHFENVEVPGGGEVGSVSVGEHGVYLTGRGANGSHLAYVVGLDGSETQIPLPELVGVDRLFIEAGPSGELVLLGYQGAFSNHRRQLTQMWISATQGLTWSQLGTLPDAEGVGSIQLVNDVFQLAVHDGVVIVEVATVPTIGLEDLLDNAGIEYQPSSETNTGPHFEGLSVVQYEVTLDEDGIGFWTDDDVTVLTTAGDLGLSAKEVMALSGDLQDSRLLRLEPGQPSEPVELDLGGTRQFALASDDAGFVMACRCVIDADAGPVATSVDGRSWLGVVSETDSLGSYFSAAGQNIVASSPEWGKHHVSVDHGRSWTEASPVVFSQYQIVASDSAFSAISFRGAAPIAHSVDGVSWRWFEAPEAEGYVTASDTHVFVVDSGLGGASAAVAELP